MDQTDKAPNVPLLQFKRTKIIATVGPSTNTYEAILALVEAGVNGFRLNFSHGTHAERSQQIKWIRKASMAYGKPVAIIQDLQGPKIRLGDFDGIVTVAEGEMNFRPPGKEPINVTAGNQLRAAVVGAELLGK